MCVNVAEQSRPQTTLLLSLYSVVKSGWFSKLVLKFKESQSKIESAVLKRQIKDKKNLRKGLLQILEDHVVKV